MDEKLIRKSCKTFKESIDRFYEGNGLVVYASKAFNTLAMCKIVEQEGLGIDVVSGGELYTAIKAGFPVEKIFFHGNNKTYDELVMALEYAVGRIIVDNYEELEMLNEIARIKNKTANIHLRIKPGIDAHTHDFIRTGQIDSKFGFALETGEAFEAAKHVSSLQNINLVGIHCHIGSQIFETEPFIEAAKVMINFMVSLKNMMGIEIKELNLGGGFGIKYIQEHDPIEYDKYLEAVAEAVKKITAEGHIAMPIIIIEPGRAIVGSAGITMYTVGSVKDIPGIRKYVSVNGGMTDNPRYALYQAEYEAVVANRADQPKTEKVTIAGKCCESGDLVAKDVNISSVEAGDYLAVLATGAYNYSMSSNYNRVPRPPVILVKDGKARVIVKREDYEDVIRNDVLQGDI
jgi:diaminopimelate decarboxylase